MEFPEGVIHAAKDCQAPAVLCLAAPDFEYYDPELFMAAEVTVCNRSSAPLALQLDYTTETVCRPRQTSHRRNKEGKSGMADASSSLLVRGPILGSGPLQVGDYWTPHHDSDTRH